LGELGEELGVASAKTGSVAEATKSLHFVMKASGKSGIDSLAGSLKLYKQNLDDSATATGGLIKVLGDAELGAESQRKLSQLIMAEEMRRVVQKARGINAKRDCSG